jgi:hypothetical protein
LELSLAVFSGMISALDTIRASNTIERDIVEELHHIGISKYPPNKSLYKEDKS